jgi:hypothetical protein
LRNLTRDELESSQHGQCRGVAEESTLNDGARLDYRRGIPCGQEFTQERSGAAGIRQRRSYEKSLTSYFRALSTGMHIANSVRMKRILVLIGLLMLTSCAHKAKVNAPPASELFLSERYSYIKGDDGRVFIVTSNTKDFDDAVKRIHLGPSSVNKLNLWVVTPLKPEKKPAH